MLAKPRVITFRVWGRKEWVWYVVAYLLGAGALAAGGGLLALAVEEVGDTATDDAGGDVELGAAIEETEAFLAEGALEQAAGDAASHVGGVTRDVGLVAAAEVEVGAALVTGLADSHLVADGLDGRGGVTDSGRGGGGEGGESQSEDGGELHFDGWVGFGRRS